ncbi:phage major capsid protein [Escherichia albertii]|nr:phage major capsid protein [Escherichia albertii]MCZ8767728.1 phage major capsid protein [Escherichia albertii]MCZ8893977.1 phage major capsid protein [Escherichia albertii]
MFFSGLFQRKSDAPVTTPAELADAIGLSYDTYTGKQISSQRAMRLTAVFSCVRVLAESVGMLPCNLYHLNGSLKQRATGERLHKLISTHPNGYMTPQEFWELVVTCLCLRGNFYAYIELKRPAGGAQNKLATEHKEAFVGFLRKGREDGLRDLERKALQVGTDEDGGYAVPEALDRNILTLLKDEVVMRQEAAVITVGGSDYKKLVNLGGTASRWVGETDARSQTATSRLGLIEPFMGEIYGNPQATQKMLDDAFFNVEAWINSELATEFAEQEEIAFTTGDGTKKPKGFLAYESTDETDKVRAFGKLQHIVSGDATAVTADAIIKLIYTLRKAHRTGAKFMMNNNSLFAIRLLKDSEGNYLWRPGLELGQPSSLAGYGIAENEQMPDIAADAKAIAFGNFKRGYTIVDRIGTRILRDPYTNKPFVGFYTTKRTGGMLVDSQAIKLLKIAAA